MVKFYESSFSYDYSFPAVALAYFLRYPNPYSTHVLSTDVIERTFDPETQRVHTVRLHLKRSKLPAAVLKILPRSLMGASASGDSQSYILETSTVDIKEGWMKTESRNMEWTGVLSVIEKQLYRRQTEDAVLRSRMGFVSGSTGHTADEKTDVTTSVTLLSRLGQNRWKKSRPKLSEDGVNPGEPEKVGFFKSWSTASIQRSIELIGLKRARTSQPNAKEGMKIVLERLRQGGLVAVLEGMRRDHELALGGPASSLLKQMRGPNKNAATAATEEINDHVDN